MSFFILIYGLVFAICLGITILFYWIPQKLGYRKTGIVLSCIAGLTIIIIAVFAIFEDELFSKGNARDLLKEQNITLYDDFELLKNKSMSGIGDYYHTFTIKISNKDKSHIISEIENSNNFKGPNESVPDITQMVDSYTGKEITQNFENDKQYIRKLYKPNGKGYAPTYRIITIDKNEDKLVFEDIDE